MNPTARRWAWIVLLGCIGALVFLTALPWGTAWVVDLSAGHDYAPWFTWTVAAVVEVGLFAAIAVPMRARYSQLRLLPNYPPLWLAVLVGCGLGIGVWASPWNPIGWPLRAFFPELGFLVIPAILGLLLAHSPWESRTPSGRSRGPTRSRGSDLNELDRWLGEEGPASPEDQDLFDRSQIVRRIASRLSQPLGCDQSVALLGRFGSGKSSILARVKHTLEQISQPRVWVCEVSCWGLESSAAAPGHILARITETIDRRVDCRALVGLPAAYQRLVSAEPTGTLGRLLESIGAQTNSADRLTQLSPILQAANARIVLFIEDADRTGGDFDPQHIQRLLWTLKSVRNVSFVIALDAACADETLLDVTKVCEHIERVPPVEPDQVRRVIRLVRAECLAGAPFIDPYAERAEKDPLDVREGRSRLEDYARRRYSNSVADALCDLLSTPRKLKHCARRVKSAWAVLRGEIDLDDLIVASALREGAPEAFEFLLRHMDGVRTREKDRTLLSDKDGLEQSWEIVRDRAASSDGVQRLVEFLALEALCSANATVRPQGIQREEPTDYFRRLRDESIPSNEIRDQEALSNMDEWQSGASDTMTTKLVAASESEDHYVRVWEHFSGRCSPGQLRQATEEVLAALKSRDGVRSSGKHPALLALWRRCHERLPREAATADWVQDLILASMPVSLDLANELYYFWASSRYGSIEVAARNTIREAAVQAARELCADATKLGAVLDPERPWGIRHLMTPVDQEEPASVLTEPAAWTWLAEPVLGLATHHGSNASPAVLHVVGDFTQQHGFDREEGFRITESYRLNRDRIDAVFGNRRGDLLKYVTDLPDGPWFVDAARKQAKEWLGEVEGESDAARDST